MLNSPAIPRSTVLKVVANKNLADCWQHKNLYGHQLLDADYRRRYAYHARMIFTRLPVQLQAMRYWTNNGDTVDVQYRSFASCY